MRLHRSGPPALAKSPWRRRRSLAGLAIASLLLSLAAPAHAKRVIVLGFDGLDPDVVRELMDQGQLPTLTRLSKEGTLQDLGTSIPPQSPVAWSNFITGLDAGGHGIFDFIHRDPKNYLPFLSTSEVQQAGKTLNVGKYQFPLKAGGFTLARHGKAFWETLEEHGVPCMIVRMPANFPVSAKAHYELSGMGTPDVRGTYGTFSYFTSDRDEYLAKKDVSGGVVYRVHVLDGKVTTALEGPPNPFIAPDPKTRRDPPRTKADLVVHVDPDQPYALLEVSGQERLLKVGEWTDWVPISLPLIPTQSIAVQARFYLKELHPQFRLYVTPVDYDAMNPAIPLCQPKSFAKDLAKATGRFYTQGMPEDTKALDGGIFTIDEFLKEASTSGGEILAQYPWVFEKFNREFPDKGCLFYYTGNLDQVSHMIYQLTDSLHAGYDPAVAAKYKDVVPDIIHRFDELCGWTLARLKPDDVLVVMSDHGFASWRRAMNLNSWLRDEGYLTAKDPSDTTTSYFQNIDWSQTRAYALGLNGLYVNLRGREGHGIVDPADKRGLLQEIAYKLVKVTDPKTGLAGVTKMYLSEDSYHDRGYLDVGPDAVVGYAMGTRGSNASALGKLPKDIFVDNTEAWGADHCMDHTTVAGMLATSRPLAKSAPTLQSLAAAILAEFGVGGFPGDVESLKAVGYISASQ
ncbi:MAG: alkaline phosphatase family protein [bacterium]